MITKYIYEGTEYTLSNENLVVGDMVFPISRGRTIDNVHVHEEFDFRDFMSGFPDDPHTIKNMDYSKGQNKTYEVHTSHGWSPKECYFKIISTNKTSRMNELTLDMLKQHAMLNDVAGVIEFAYKHRLPYPKQPVRPVLKNNHNSIDIEAYLNAFKEYESLMRKFAEEKAEYFKTENHINSVIKDYLWEETGLNRLESAASKEKIWSRAYEDGHSDGMYEVYLKLCNLIELFN
jgi:hypothetical protein